jgi:enoyl-CoA hydratase/carnithine racemase
VRNGTCKYYLLLREPLLGADAARIGLISVAVVDSKIDAKAFVTRLSGGAQIAIRLTNKFPSTTGCDRWAQLSTHPAL